MFENPTVNLSALCKSCAKIACSSSELVFTFLYAGSSIRQARQQFVSCVSFSSVNFALQTHKKKKNLKGSGLEIQTAQWPFKIRHMFLWPFFSQWPIVSPLQSIDLSTWNPLYIFSIVIHSQPVCMASVESVYWRHILRIQQDSCALCLSTTKGQGLYSQQPRGRVYFF